MDNFYERLSRLKGRLSKHVQSCGCDSRLDWNRGFTFSQTIENVEALVEYADGPGAEEFKVLARQEIKNFKKGVDK